MKRAAGFQSGLKSDRLKASNTEQKRDFKETVASLLPF